MKKVLIAFVVLFVHVSLFAGSGGYGRSQTYLSIDVFEQSVNFYYRAVNDTVFYENEKGKEKHRKATVNVAFYDIEKDSAFLVFDEDFNQEIVSFVFERSYNKTDSVMDVVAIDNKYSNSYVKNNRNILPRQQSDNIYIVTYSYQNEMHYLWSCHKSGRKLIQLAEFADFSDFKIDVYNELVLVIEAESKNAVVIKKIEG